jgi:hypothetical protein
MPDKGTRKILKNKNGFAVVSKPSKDKKEEKK